MNFLRYIKESFSHKPTTNSLGDPIAPTEAGIANFWQWFGDSKVVDSAGRPIVMYHGTNTKFSTIQMKKGAQGIFWTTSDKGTIERGESGAQGVSIIMPLYVKIEHPAGWKEYDQLMIDEFKSCGLDGAILPMKTGFDAFVLSADRIKSVDNVGTFDPNNKNILKERSSIDKKKIFIDTMVESLMDALRNKKATVANIAEMPFGKFTGVIAHGAYDESLGIKPVFYLGSVRDQRGRGRADVNNDRNAIIYVYHGDIIDALADVLDRMKDGETQKISDVAYDVAETLPFTIGGENKKVLFHELSHIYDLLHTDNRPPADNNKAWTSRWEELEAELTMLYNAILEDLSTYKNKEEFEKRYPLNYDGLSLMASTYDTLIGSFLGRANNSPETTNIDTKKILRRLADIHQKIMEKLPA